MTLRQVLISTVSPVSEKMLRIVPEELLCKGLEQYTAEMFSALRKVLEVYASEVAFSGRVEIVREINEICDGFFDYTFSKACQLERVFDNTEMDILLLKELQGGSDESRYNQTQADRAEAFGMSTNAMQARIHSLEQGKEILGHYVKIEIDGRGRTAYDNTIHPVFCALNLKEVYFLTVELQKAFKGTAFTQVAHDISTDIYAQLSEYARDRLRPQIEEAGLEFEQGSVDALIGLREERRDAIYFLKSGLPCVLQLANGENYVGRIQSGESGLALEDSAGQRIPLPEDPHDYVLKPVETAGG